MFPLRMLSLGLAVMDAPPERIKSLTEESVMTTGSDAATAAKEAKTANKTDHTIWRMVRVVLEQNTESDKV